MSSQSEHSLPLLVGSSSDPSLAPESVAAVPVERDEKGGVPSPCGVETGVARIKPL